MAELQQALDAWVDHYNTERPHQALGMRPPIERFQLATGPGGDRRRTQCRPGHATGGGRGAGATIVRLPGVQRWVDQHGLISLGGFRYRVPIVLAGEPVEAVAAEHLVRIFHRDVLVAEHVQRRKPDTGQHQEVRLRQGSRRPRRATDGMVVTRVVDSSGYVSFAGTNYRVGTDGGPQRSGLHRRRLRPVQHRRPHRAGPSDPSRPGQRAWRVRHPERAAPPPTGCAGRGRRQGHAAARSAYRPSLDPDPLTRRKIAATRNHQTRRTMLIMSRRYRNSFVKRVPELDITFISHTALRCPIHTEPYMAPASARASSWLCTYVAMVNQAVACPEPLADHGCGYAAKMHQRAARVPSIVEPDARQSRGLGHAPELIAEPFWAVGVAGAHRRPGAHPQSPQLEEYAFPASRRSRDCWVRSERRAVTMASSSGNVRRPRSVFGGTSTIPAPVTSTRALRICSGVWTGRGAIERCPHR